MDYIFGIIVAVTVMSMMWTDSGRSAGRADFFPDILTGTVYFLAFSIGSLIAGALFKVLLIAYAYGGAWAGAMIAGQSVVNAHGTASLAYEQIAGVDFSLGTGANILWGWTLCFIALSFRILSGRWPHQRTDNRI